MPGTIRARLNQTAFVLRAWKYQIYVCKVYRCISYLVHGMQNIFSQIYVQFPCYDILSFFKPTNGYYCR